MLLAVDMGNTNIEFGLLDNDRIILSERVSTDTSKTAAEYAVVLHNIFEIRKVKVEDIEGAIISSVVPPLTNAIKEAIKTITGKTPLIVAPGVKTGLKINVEDAKAVGADLIVGCVAGVAQHGFPLIVIDLGTASTIVVVDREGNVVARFEPTEDMKKVAECVASLI